MRGLVCGVGINDADYQVSSVVNGKRVLCHFIIGGTGLSNAVTETGHTANVFTKVAAWQTTGSRSWPSKTGCRSSLGRGNSLDKDILRPWEKFYCQETSVFIPQWLNALCTESANRKSDLPLGVSRNPRSKPNPFMARIRGCDGKQFLIGVFPDPESAHVAWREAKANILREAVKRYELLDRNDNRICAALEERARKTRGMTLAPFARGASKKSTRPGGHGYAEHQ